MRWKGYTSSYHDRAQAQADEIIEIALIPLPFSLCSLVQFNVTERCFPQFFICWVVTNTQVVRRKIKKYATPTRLPSQQFFFEPGDFEKKEIFKYFYFL